MRRNLVTQISIAAVLMSLVFPLQGNASMTNDVLVVNAATNFDSTAIESATFSDTLSEYGALPSASHRFACAVRSSGSVECWGWNGGGALGVNPNTLTFSRTPRTIPGISNAVYVSTGSDITGGTSSPCALLSSGEVKCWGRNSLGQLGDGTKIDSWAPVLVSGVSGATALTVGPASACAILSGGALKCWGNSYYMGEQNISDAISVSINEMVGCVVVQDGRVKCWGTNYRGQLGDGQVSGFTRGPEFVQDASDALEVHVGRNFVCAKLSTDLVTCWGMNTSGQVLPATPVEGLEASASLSVGDKACSVSKSGELFCWDGPGEPVSKKLSVSNVVYVSQNGDRTCVTLTSGAIDCWGLLEFTGPDYQNAVYSQTPQNVYGFSGIVISTTNSSIKLSATSGRVDSIALTYKKFDSQSWTELSCGSTCNIADLTPGTRYMFRFELFELEKSLGSFSGVEASTGGTGTFSVQVTDSAGNPISLGSYTWASLDGLNKSSSAKTGTVLGGATFNSVPAKMILITVTGALLSDGSSVTGTFTTQATNGAATLSLPIAPNKQERLVKVQLPSGDPVPGATVSSTGLSSSAPIQSSSFSGSVSLTATLSGVTDSDGLTKLVGYALEPLLVQATYDDGELNQSTAPTAMAETLTTLELDYLPIVSLTKEEVTAPVNSIVSIPISVGDAEPSVPARLGLIGRSSFGPRAASTKSYGGVQVSVSPPPGASQTACKSKTALSATTSSTGRATLKVCASVSGEYIIRTRGAVSAGAVTIRVSNSKPMQVTSLDSRSLAAGKALIAWGLPRYSGGSTIKSYTVVASATGSPTITKVFTSTSSSFKTRSFNFSGLAPDKRWTFKVTSTNKYGTSPSASTNVLVRGTR